MSHHKRKRPKNRRAGCLMCKRYKVNGTSKLKRMRPSERRRLGRARGKIPEPA